MINYDIKLISQSSLILTFFLNTFYIYFFFKYLLHIFALLSKLINTRVGMRSNSFQVFNIHAGEIDISVEFRANSRSIMISAKTRRDLSFSRARCEVSIISYSREERRIQALGRG